MVKELENAHYMTIMVGGFNKDQWRLTGLLNGNIVHTSTPVKFDKEKMTVTTFSGSVYRIASISDHTTREKLIQYIEEDVARSQENPNE